MKKVLNIRNRIPKDYFITKGKGESDIQIHAGSYHLALKEAGVESYNIMTYSSILPGIAREVKKPKNLVHGEVMETIMAASSATKGKRATAAIIFGWLYDKKTKKKFGGLVCEYNGSISEKKAGESLRASLNELYINGFDDKYDLKDINLITNTIVPKKKYGTALVAICFVNFVIPLDK
ncbi:pyruvoyl-dependent arginine decarboxylase [Candidatus Woesearchaeota archaeon]|nr:pyruvoyl-dependent arginine decarboxylase [Candidatus Woesearchaeota archaeon]MCF7901285.1 pyruvoyl-dependent arginine decarboxylase [Candidatus Woesearchaeota archaeon]MCF8013774.1 pyruvoyl-dependent arginine decarboxylase [Candidatus Woesearchaeota archaeon]